MVEEMRKFRELLNASDIRWEDDSYQVGEYSMTVTRVRIGRKAWTIINGFGSFGGLNPRTGVNHGMLEIWDGTVKNQPEGWLTAEQAIQKIKTITNMED